MARYALVVIDMQNAYFNNGALAEQREDLMRRASELIKAANKYDIPIYNVSTEHATDKSTWTLNMLDDGEGYLFRGEDDANNVAELDLTGAKTIHKTRDSAFFKTDFLDNLKGKGVENLVLLGVSTHSCVFLTAADAYAHNFRVLLAKDAIASHDPSYHESTLALLQQEYRQKSYTNLNLVNMLEKI